MSTLPDDGSEWLQANLQLPELNDPAAQAEILQAIEGKPGVRSVVISGTSLHVVYDPLGITEHELERLLTRGGHPAAGATVERDTPFTGEQPL